MAKLTAVFPVDFVLHAFVLRLQLPFAAAVSVVAVTTTVLVIWVIEPSATRLLARWMHGPALRDRERFVHADTLWRIRIRLRDAPGQLEALTTHLARHRVNILTVHVHQVEDGALDELVVAAPAGLSAQDLSRTLLRTGGSGIRVWPATAMALIDGQTKALGLAARVVADPGELPLAVAELLGAHILAPGSAAEAVAGASVLELTASTGESLRFYRRDEPFTPAEAARAQRLSDLSDIRSSVRNRETG